MQPFDFHAVADRLFVGPCPSSPERIRAVHAAGVRTLLCLQTDDDLDGLGMQWPLLYRFLMAQGISAHRCAIRDFDDAALARGLPAAVERVSDLHQGGGSVYLHCTAGINRSPTVAIGFLVAHGGLDFDTAWRQVTERRPCAPNRTALDRWLAAQVSSKTS
ncbi:MAG: hypothetical protein EXR79_05810 [Myxococcales bacterium]|nr:hypothetical protein [Myxococcales bacterium]